MIRPPALHTTDRPSTTAQWTALGRALELRREPDERIVTDQYAPVFLAIKYQPAIAERWHGISFHPRGKRTRETGRRGYSAL